MANIVYIIGAGASKAISPGDIPAMDDFLQIAFNNFEFNEGVVYADAMDALIKIKALKKWLRPGNKFSFSDRESYGQYKTFYRNILAKNTSTNINLENLFTHAEENWQQDSGLSQKKLIDLINWLFSKIDKKLTTVLRSSKNPYNLLAESITKGKASTHTHTFVSFNYDVWLERSLFNRNSKSGMVWHPRDGYEYGWKTEFLGYLGPFDQNQLRATPRKFPHISSASKIRVLKPHGSLSWIQSLDNAYTHPLLLLDADTIPVNTKQGNVSIMEVGKQTISVNVIASGGVEIFGPLLVPPNPTKARSGSLFWEIQKEVDRKLEGADIVIIIGWSMPTTDEETMRRIERVVDKRGNQLKHLVVCNLNQPDPFYSKFEQYFWPKYPPHIFNEGFNKKFIDNCITPLLTSTRID